MFKFIFITLKDTKIRANFLYFVLFIFFTTNISAQNLWHKMEAKSLTVHPDNDQRTFQNATVFSLEIDQLSQQLLKVEDKSSKAQSKTIIIPDNNGEPQTFILQRADLFHPILLAKYPEIATFKGYSKDKKNQVIRCDISPNGFFAMIMKSGKPTQYIDPVTINGKALYISYFKNDMDAPQKAFHCGLNTTKQSNTSSKTEKAAPDCTLRKYRLALACTGEYAAFHGGTKVKVLAAMNTTMNRVGGLYERDLAVTFEIIANNDQIIYLDANTDPYTNNDGGVMLGENQDNIDNIIGNGNYDIGHVFSTGGGGIASLSAVCSNGNKAQGVTGLGSPIGDGFDVDYVAHEMGHQFNANHTFNVDCGGNVNQSTGYETGSGTTIMGYAGVCDPNVQFNSDDLFHEISLDEISTYITQGVGGTCPQSINVSNIAPIVNAGMDRTIPKGTPFELNAIASDVDSDSLTYAWEQFNNNPSTQPPVGSSTEGPLFRCFKPVNDSLRSFPMLTSILNNTSSIWEVLPNVARVMNFMVTVRDNHQSGGCFDTDNVVLTVAGNAGPFQITSQNTFTTWDVGTTKTITWNVSNTDKAPVSCSKVKIYLSLDGGLTFPILLAANENNDGTANVIVPNKLTSKARIKIKGVNNVFFDINNLNITIKEPLIPDYLVDLVKNDFKICKESGNDTDTIQVFIQGLAGFKDTLDVTLSNLPPGLSYTLSKTPVVASTALDIIISGIQSASDGTFPIDVIVTSKTKTKTATTFWVINGQKPGPVNVLSPSDLELNVPLLPIINWEKQATAVNYQIVVSSDMFFNNIVEEAITTDTFYQMINALKLSGVYYCKVISMNVCGSTALFNSFKFQTQKIKCTLYTNSTPLVIPIDMTTDENVLVSVTETKPVLFVSAFVELDHSWLGDVGLTLTSPDNLSVGLYDYSCDSKNDIDAEFTDDGLDLICGNSTPTVSGRVKPANNQFAQFSNSIPTGNWTLNVIDSYGFADGGTLQKWSVNVCVQDSAVYGIEKINNNVLLVKPTTNTSITTAFLKYQSSNPAATFTRFVLSSTTAQGKLKRGTTVMTAGMSFTSADISSGIVRYQQDQPSATLDQFTFDAFDDKAGWLPNQQFNIEIISALTGTSNTLFPLCYGDSTGTIVLTPQGGKPPYTYSINNKLSFSSDSIFNQLPSAGYFTWIVDAFGQEVSALVEISQPSQLELQTSTVPGTIIISANGGTAPYLTSIYNGMFTSLLEYDSLDKGSYIVVLKDANNCSVSDTLNISGTATNEITKADIRIFPNPGFQKINILTKDISNLEMTIYDLNGKKVMQQILLGTNNGREVSTDNLATGTYIIQFTTESQSKYFKWIKLK